MRPLKRTSKRGCCSHQIRNTKAFTLNSTLVASAREQTLWGRSAAHSQPLTTRAREAEQEVARVEKGKIGGWGSRGVTLIDRWLPLSPLLVSDMIPVAPSVVPLMIPHADQKYTKWYFTEF